MDYSIELWGSDKGLGNDDCLTGSDHGTLEEAEAALAKLTAAPYWANQWAYAYIEGPQGRVSTTKNPNYRKTADEDDGWANEFAQQQGMSFGIGAYNEARGYDTSEPEEGYRGPGMR